MHRGARARGHIPVWCHVFGLFPLFCVRRARPSNPKVVYPVFVGQSAGMSDGEMREPVTVNARAVMLATTLDGISEDMVPSKGSVFAVLEVPRDEVLRIPLYKNVKLTVEPQP
jgi:hypothetical protein